MEVDEREGLDAGERHGAECQKEAYRPTYDGRLADAPAVEARVAQQYIHGNKEQQEHDGAHIDHRHRITAHIAQQGGEKGLQIAERGGTKHSPKEGNEEEDEGNLYDCMNA